MGDAYRNESEAVFQRAEALRRENDELKRRLARAERVAAADARIAALQQENAELRARLAASAHHRVPAPTPPNTAAVAAVGGLLAVLATFVATSAARSHAPARPVAVERAHRGAYDAVRAAAARERVVPVAPESQLGRVAVRVEPGHLRGLEVTIDDAPVALSGGRGVTASLDAREVHLLRARANGYHPVSMPIWVRAGQVDPFTVRLFPREPARR